MNKKTEKIIENVLDIVVDLILKATKIFLKTLGDIICFAGHLILTVVPIYYWWNYGLSDDLNLPSLSILDIVSIIFIIDFLFKRESLGDFMKETRKNRSDH